MTANATEGILDPHLPRQTPMSKPQSVMYAEPPLHKPRLRIGIMLNSFTVEAWQAKILNDLVSAPYLEVSLIIINRAPKVAEPSSRLGLRDKWPTLLYRLYHQIDRKLHQAEEKNAFANADVLKLLSGSNLIEVMPIQKKYVDRFEESDIEQIKSAKLDVILRFGFRVIKGDILNCAKYGVWSFHHGDSRYFRGGPPLFWEISERNPVSGTTLQILNESLDGGRVLYRSRSATNFTSLHRSRNGIYWKTADFMIRRLGQLYAFGWDALAKLDTYNELNAYNKPIYRTPTNWQMLRFLANRGLLFLRNGIQLFWKNQWFLGIQTNRPTGDQRGPGWDLIYPARDRYYADPFLFAYDGRRFIFFEDYSYRTKLGSISCLEIDQHGNYSEPVTVLERSYHLSYPFVFQWGSDIFMMPETSDNHAVEVYRAVNFPDKWELHKVLLSDVVAVDPTLLQHDGRFWLFVNMATTEGAPLNDELFLFHSDSPFGPWLPHAQNPIISDVCSARPAGRIFERDGQLIRPSQDCSLRYGHKIKLNRIEVLTETEYRESEIGEIGPAWIRGNRATHCLARDQSLQVVDGCRSIRSGRLWPGLFSKTTVLTCRPQGQHFVWPWKLQLWRRATDS